MITAEYEKEDLFIYREPALLNTWADPSIRPGGPGVKKCVHVLALNIGTLNIGTLFWSNISFTSQIYKVPNEKFHHQKLGDRLETT